jgi:fructokinase
VRIGIDLGGTKIEGIALDGSREVARSRVPTTRNDYDATLVAIVSLVNALEQRIPLARRSSESDGGNPESPSTSLGAGRIPVGVGIPGTISASTGLVKNANSTWLIGQPLREDLEARLGRPVRISNDANCFAISEATDGAAAGAHVVFGVIVGTGVGGGIVIDGQIVQGANGIAGEWGHNPLPWPDAGESSALAPSERSESRGPQCYCGKRGCIETFLSGPGLSADHEQMSRVKLEAPQIVEAAERGDAAAEETLRRYERRMARALASIINVLDPDVIVLGGGMSNVARLYTNVPRVWGEFVFACGASLSGSPRGPEGSAPLQEPVRTLLLPARHGDASGVRGAAWLWPPA